MVSYCILQPRCNNGLQHHDTNMSGPIHFSYPVFKMKFVCLVNSVVKGKATGPTYQTGQGLRGHHRSTYRACTVKLHHLVAVIVSLSQNCKAIVKHLRIIHSLAIWHLKMYDIKRDPLRDSQWLHQLWLWW